MPRIFDNIDKQLLPALLDTVKVSYREAYQLTGLSGSTFDRFAENLGFRV